MKKLSGNVSKLGVAGAFRLMLFERDTGDWVATTTSGIDGTYLIENIPDHAEGYFLVAFDDTVDPVGAAVSDQLILEEMV